MYPGLASLFQQGPPSKGALYGDAAHLGTAMTGAGPRRAGTKRNKTQGSLFSLPSFRVDPSFIIFSKKKKEKKTVLNCSVINLSFFFYYLIVVLFLSRTNKTTITFCIELHLFKEQGK